MAGLLQQCCCCNLRTGSFCSGVYTLIMSIALAALISVTVIEDPNQSPEKVWTIVSLLLNGVATFIVSIILIVGIHKDAYHLLIPWIIIMIISTLFDAAQIINLISQKMSLRFITNIIQSIVWLTATLVNIYCILCVVSHYFELKQGRGTRQDIENQRHRISSVYRSDVNQVLVTTGSVVMYPVSTGQYESVPTEPSSVDDTKGSVPNGKHVVLRPADESDMSFEKE